MTAASRRAAFRVVCVSRTGPDRAASLADTRTALCAARGVPVGDIDPGTGYDLTRRAYETACREWRQRIADGPLDSHMRHGYQAARDYWATRRPEYLTDWPDAG